MVDTLLAGVQLDKVRVATELPEKAATPSNVVEVVAAPLVKENDPVQVPLTVKVFEKPLEESLV